MTGLVIVGTNHRTAPVGVRDLLFVDDAEATVFLLGLGLPEVLVLSTCDRVELWAWQADPGLLTSALLARVPSAPLYALTGEEALHHAFAVTSAMDSLIIGEPQVPGQVKAAARLARQAGTMGTGLEGVLDAALSAAKRVRTETAIGEGPVSIAAAACQVARDLHGDLSTRRAILAGAGDMGEMVAESLLAAGLGHLDVTAPRTSRAEAVARALNANVIPFESLPETLPLADVVLSAVGARVVTFGTDVVARALKARRRRPVFLVDCAIPGDVDPAVNRLDGAFLYDLTDLERVAMKGRSSREQSAVAARAIVEEEVAAFGKDRTARQAVPVIVGLRRYFEDQRLGVLDENIPSSEATRLLINRLLHNPSEVLKEAAAQGEDWQSMERLLKKLFRLE